MTALPESLGHFRTELEHAIGREQSVRRRTSKRRRMIVVLFAAAVVVTASGVAMVRELFFVGPVARGQLSRTVDGVRFSMDVPRAGWENGPHVVINGNPRTHSLYISKSTFGPQGAEAIVLWTGLRGGGVATPCAKLFGPAIHGSSSELAAAVASAPGTRLVRGPTRVTVGGRPAMHVVLTVRKRAGCDPGYFFSWRATLGGAFWAKANVGDTIRVWIVDVDGRRLFIQAETTWRAGQAVQREIAQIVGSIRFD